jgi:EAL domain-containing protein (putative c-di-GMP-specific phosphodiesterase class I)
MRPSFLETLLDPARLAVRFQPIFQIKDPKSPMYGVEALIRGPQGSNFERAEILFDYVRRKNAELAMDRSCLCAVCKAAASLPRHVRLNANVHATTLAQRARFTDFLLDLADRYSLAPERLTIEIVEHGPACNVPGLVESLAALRNAGVRIALDDVGLGQSNYRMMLDCRPEYFKLDSYFARGLKNDPMRLAVVQSIVTLASAIGSSVVAEGVESAEDVCLLRDMGVEFIQANMFCAALPIEKLWATGLLDPPDMPLPAATRDRALDSGVSWATPRVLRAAVGK